MGWLIGGISGLVVARGGLQPFVATLAMMVSALGGARLMAGQDRSVYPIYTGVNAPESFELLRETVLGVPVPGLVFLGVVGVFALLLSRFRFGRYLYAIGGNERTAFLSGVPVYRIKVLVYALSGMLATLAGVLYTAQYRQGKPDAGTGLELDAIAAVVIGGANLMGGKGTVGGTLIGVLIFGILTNIFQLNNIDSNTQLLLKGIIIVLAVLVQEGSLSSLFRNLRAKHRQGWRKL
jgi:simple sugar transport system permease protein